MERTIRFGRMALLLASLFVAQGTLNAGERKNVVLIFSDDQGTIDINCYGSEDLHTPHLDALASRGLRFSQFYSAAPVCSPSRAALLTGRYPQRCGVPGNVGLGRVGLEAREITIAEMLKADGYATAIVGKWHLGRVLQHGPVEQGFDRFFGHKKGCIDNYSHFFYWSGPNVHDLWIDEKEHWEDGVHFSDLMVREATHFIEKNKDRPFFLYLPFNIPHYPLQGQAEFRKLYEKLDEPRRSYAALVSTLDSKVGQVVRKIDELGLRKKTLIIFMSDHGHSTEERTRFGGGNAGPYRGAKFSLLEGGIRVPAIVSLPGTIPEGEVRDQLAVAVDWLPTIAEICDVDLPDRKIDGKSLMGVIQSRSASSPHEIYHWQSGAHNGKKQWAVREGTWKLVVNAKGTTHREWLEGEDRVFLSDLSKDATERRNIAKQHPDVVKRLQALHAGWLRDVQNRD